MDIVLFFLVIVFFCIEIYLSVKGILTYNKIEQEFVEELPFEEKVKCNRRVYTIGIDCMMYYQLAIFFYVMYKVQCGIVGINIYPDALLLMATILLFYAVHICNGEFNLFGEIRRYKNFFQLSLFCNIVLALSIIPAMLLVI